VRNLVESHHPKHLEMKKPREATGETLCGLHWHWTHGGGAANKAKFENLSCALQGVPWQGVDPDHRQLRRPYFVLSDFMVCSTSSASRIRC